MDWKRPDMKSPKHTLIFRRNTISRCAVALLSVAVLLTSILSVSLSATQKSTASMTRLSEDQRILHVLNRLGFGARPGDVERVKAMGLENYINQQLNPDKINDTAAQDRVKNLDTLNMTTAELYEKFPQPGQLLRQLERRGELPAGLASARANRNNPSQGQMPNQSSEMSSEMGSETAAKTNNDGPSPNKRPADDPNPRDNQEYRQALREYYRQNGLQQPQRIMAELQASRILRAVYSERQLQEVMVDFWTNHFNVFAGKGADRWLLISYDRDTIRPNAMGKFSELLAATAQSPAMLFYLDNFQSVSPNAQTAFGPRPAPLSATGSWSDGWASRTRRIVRWSGTRRHPILKDSVAELMRTTLASLWSCTRWALTAVTPRKTCRKLRDVSRDGPSTHRAAVAPRRLP